MEYFSSDLYTLRVRALDTVGLGTLAEIFIGLAGFSGISLVLRSNPSKYFLFRVLLIVALSLVSIVVTLIPTPLIHLGIEETTIWRVGSGVLVVTYLIALPLLLHYREAAKAYSEASANGINATLMVFVGLLICTQVVNVLGIVDEYAYPFLFFGLIGVLAYCGTLFIISLTIGKPAEE